MPFFKMLKGYLSVVTSNFTNEGLDLIDDENSISKYLNLKGGILGLIESEEGSQSKQQRDPHGDQIVGGDGEGGFLLGYIQSH